MEDTKIEPQLIEKILDIEIIELASKPSEIAAKLLKGEKEKQKIEGKIAAKEE